MCEYFHKIYCVTLDYMALGLFLDHISNFILNILASIIKWVFSFCFR